MTSVAERVPLERISRRAHAARPGRTVLAVVASVLFGVGWVAYKLCAVAWLALAWSGSAMIEAWIGVAYAASALAEGWVAGRSADWAQQVARRQEAQRAGRRR